MALRSFPVAFSHAYSQIRPFLLHAGYRQARLYSQRDMGVFLPKSFGRGNNQWQPNEGTIAVVRSCRRG